MPTPQRPSPLDEVLYQDPAMTVGALLHLNGTPPPLTTLTEHVRRHLHRLPALTLTIENRASHSRWHHLRPALEHHIRSQALPPGGAPHEAVRELAQAPLPANEPPWDLTLLHGHAPGRYALLYRVNHGLQDGGGFVHTLETLFSPTPIPPVQSSALVRPLIDAPRPTLRQTADAARLLARATTRTGLWPHPEHGYSAERTLRWTAVPTHALHALARPYGGTGNDAYIAALAHTLQHWTARHHPRPAAGTPLTVAISTRTPATLGLPGNHATAGRFTLHGAGTALSQSLRATVQATALLKSPPHRAAIRHISRGTPPWLIRKAFTTIASPERATVFCSGVAFRHPLSFLNHPVDAIDPLVCLPLGSPACTFLFTYQGLSSVLFTTDSALPGMDRLHHRWQDTVHAAEA